MTCKASRNRHFTNWAKTYECKPELYFEPQNVSEVQQVLREADQNGKCVRAVGGGHSPSDIACTPDYMVSLSNMNNVLDINKEDNTVLAEGGIMMTDLNEALYNSGLAFSVLGAVSDLTLAGVVSTGTHGTGTQYSILSSYVVELEIVTASGNVEFLTKEKDAEKMKSFALSLGALGIITKVRIQCEPRFRLKQTSYGAPLKDVIENLDVHLKASEHFRFFWYPLTDQCILYHTSRTQEPAKKQKESWFWDRIIGFILLEFLLWLSTWIPSLMHLITAVYYRINSARNVKVDSSYKVFNFDCLFKQYVMEWSFPIEKTGVVLYELDSWLQSSGFKAHFPVEARFVRADDIYLSPAYKQDSCYINILMFRPYHKYVEHASYWNAFKKIMLEHGGRPHWAKDHLMTSKELQPLYPKWAEFARLREQYDPRGMFMNDYLRSTLGDK